MRLTIEHITHYHYDEPVRFALQQLRMAPKEREGQQKILNWTIEVEGGSKQLHYTDHHGNGVDLISIDSGAQQMSIRCRGEVEITDQHGVVGPHRGLIPLWSYQSATPLTKAGGLVKSLLAKLGKDFESDISRAHALSGLILAQLPYEIGVTGPSTTAEQALAGKGGVCQDHSHIFIAAMRALGHPARYVSGYLKMNDREDQDATHAWAEAYFDHIGWVGFDVSNGQSPDGRYVCVATGLDYHDAAPVRGMRYGSSEEKLQVALQVQQ